MTLDVSFETDLQYFADFGDVFKVKEEGVVYSVNSKTPDANGNVAVTASDVGALSANTVSDAYSSSKTYTAGSYCTYNGTLYKCKQQCSNVVPTNTTYWEATTIASALTKKNRANSSISFGTEYVAKNDLYLRVYSPYAAVTNNGYFMFYANGEVIDCWRPDTQNTMSHSVFIRQGLTYRVSKNSGLASVDATAIAIEVY